jgi:hypothetical protein
MDPLNGANPVLAALRRQVAENVQRMRTSGKLGPTNNVQGGQSGPVSLDDVLRRKLKGIDKQSAAGRSQATKAFVEVVLAAEFGEAVLSDPAFGDMLAELSTSLRADPELSASIDKVLAEA